MVSGHRLRKMLGFVVLMVSAAGCSTVGSYREVEPGKYLVSVHSNAFSSSKKIKAKHEQKAHEACDGEFHVVEVRDAATQTIKTYDAYNTSANVLNTQTVVACGPAPVQIRYYEHPQFGVVELPDERYSSERSACETDVYSRGVVIKGATEYDAKTIRAYEVSALVWAAINLKREQMAALAEHLPATYHEALRVGSEVSACMAERGWQNPQTRTEPR